MRPARGRLGGSLCGSSRPGRAPTTKTAGAAPGSLDQSARGRHDAADAVGVRRRSRAELRSRPRIDDLAGGCYLDTLRIDPFHVANPPISPRGTTLNATR